MAARNIYLTFDVEDFINDSSIWGLQTILELMEKTKLKGIFFITGHMAERLKVYKDLLSMLSAHTIGYHSTSHSIRPAIFEYTDIPDYSEAIESSLFRETSHIDPYTGEATGIGGLPFIKTLFPTNEINAFRAPGYSWSPPHLEALYKLGIRFDFSSNFSKKPIQYSGIIFYPYPLHLVPPEGKDFGYRLDLRISQVTMANHDLVINIHPHSLFNQSFWDSQYWASNPAKLFPAARKSQKESQRLIKDLSVFLKALSFFQDTSSVEITPELRFTTQTLQPSMKLAATSYTAATFWPIRRFKYSPRYLYGHILHFLHLQ